LLTSHIESNQPFQCVGDGQAVQDLTTFTEPTRVMMGVAPVNAKKDLHRASLSCGETEALSADAVTVFLLEPWRGRPLWTVTPLSLG
jgi:hypothetical protein